MRAAAYDRTDVGAPQSGKSLLIQMVIRDSAMEHPQAAFAAIHYPTVADHPNGRIFENAEHLPAVRKIRACGSLLCKMLPIHPAAPGLEQRVGKSRTIGQIAHHPAGTALGKTFVQPVCTFG